MKRLFWLLFLVSCGSDNSGKQTPANPDKNPPPTNTDNPRLDDGQDAGWFGMVTKCVVDVAVKDKHLEQKVVCSETLKGDSYDDVSSKLANWKKANCPDVLTVRKDAGDTDNVSRWRPTRPQSVISNSRASVDEKRAMDGFCASNGFLYGSPVW